MQNAMANEPRGIGMLRLVAAAAAAATIQIHFTVHRCVFFRSFLFRELNAEMRVI